MKKNISIVFYCKYMDYFVKGIFAGLLISIGGTTYLAASNKILGSLGLINNTIW